MNSLQELILQRQSVRRFSNTPVEREKVMQCIEAARLSPSASNAQPWSIVIVDNPEMAAEVAGATYDNVLTFNRFVSQAPVIAVFVVEKVRLATKLGSWIKNRDFPWIDHGIMASQFCLMAAEFGLGTCMLGWFNEKRVKRILNIPAAKRVSLLIALGYPVDGYLLRQKIRKPLNDILSFNGYRKSRSGG